MADKFDELSWNENMPKRDNGQALDPKEFIFRYLKYLPWVLVCAAIASVIAYIKIRYTTPIFHAQSSMLIKDQDASGPGGRDPRFQELFMSQGSTNLNNEVQILKSSSIIERVVKSLELQTSYYNIGKIRSSFIYPDAPFRLEIIHLIDSNAGIELPITVKGNDRFSVEKDTSSISFGQVFAYNDNRLILVRNPMIDLHAYPSPQFLISNHSSMAAAGGLMGGLRITAPEDGTTILTLSFDGENTALGINVLNKLMTVYDSLIIEDKNHISVNTLRFIDDQLEILKGQLSNIEGKTKGFMIENNAFDMTGQSRLYIDNIEEITKKTTEQQVKVAVVDLLLNYISDPKNKDKLVPTSLGVEEPAVLQFVMEYNRLQLQREASVRTTRADNPLIKEMDGTLEKMRNNLLQALSNVKQGYQITINSLRQQAEGNQSQLRSVPGKSMQLTNIQRQQKILEDLYSFLLMKRLETSISSAATVSNSKVIEPAAASYEPVSPNKKGIYTFHLLIGLLIPVGIIVLIEVLKDKVSGRADVEKRTRTPILGEIGHSEDSQTLVVTNNSRRFVAEQFRIIRSNLQYIIGKKEKPVIMVTSSYSGEGKSFVSTNIGAVIALTGKKTVIMEFDIRKPKIVAGLDLKRKMGITNYIIGRVSFEDLLLPVQEVENLYVIPCGPIPPNPAELLLDSKLEELMEEVIKNFDVVIMDTAPVGLVSDAINLSKYADCTLYVVRQGYTFRKQIQLIEELYVEKKLPKISVLLNDVKPEGGYFGGYGYYGSYGYYGDSKSQSGYFEKEHPVKKKKYFAKWIQQLGKK